MNILVKSWSDLIAKVIKGMIQFVFLENKLNKRIFFLISLFYINICMCITYMSNDWRCLIAIIPSIIEFYSLLNSSTKKYRWYVVITKIFWTINNIIFELYIGIIFDVITIIAHLLKINQIREKEKIFNVEKNKNLELE